MPINISVVIPTYQRPALLRNCLQAMLQQNFDRNCYEVIVVSDGYDTKTEKLVGELSSGALPIHYLHLPQKKGPAAARNMGWRSAQGKLVLFTDDDTVPDADWINGYWMAYGGEAKIAFTGKIKVPLSSTPTDYEKNTAGLETAEFVTANCACTKTALEAVGGFDERFSMAWREDSDLEFKLLLAKIPVVKVAEALVVHPVRKAKWGVSVKEQKKGLFNALLYKKYPHLYRQKIQKTPAWNYYVMVLSLILLLAGFAVQNYALSLVAFICWLLLLIGFIRRRLRNTSKSFEHIMEMILTSMIIPFASVYWQLYGAVKYRVLFI